MWYQATPNFLARCLTPFSQLFFFLASRRRSRLSAQVQDFGVPIVVVGNISIGGTGKTPAIIALANRLMQQGIKVGIVSRGYGSHAGSYPFEVTTDANANQAGDEALLIARATASPVFIDRDRVAAVKRLLERYPNTEIILSDDGLQHYRLPRSVEIIIIDGQKGIGNGCGLPAGPLREPKERLNEANFILVNGEPSEALADHLQGLNFDKIHLEPTVWSPVAIDQNQKTIKVGEKLPWQDPVVAIAAIGNPQRFFDTLLSLNIDFLPIAFDDHHQFTADDFLECKNQTVVMTAKDAVKCSGFAKQNWWQLEVACTLPEPIIHSLKTLTIK